MFHRAGSSIPMTSNLSIDGNPRLSRSRRGVIPVRTSGHPHTDTIHHSSPLSLAAPRPLSLPARRAATHPHRIHRRRRRRRPVTASDYIRRRRASPLVHQPSSADGWMRPAHPVGGLARRPAGWAGWGTRRDEAWVVAAADVRFTDVVERCCCALISRRWRQHVDATLAVVLAAIAATTGVRGSADPTRSRLGFLYEVATPDFGCYSDDHRDLRCTKLSPEAVGRP